MLPLASRTRSGLRAGAGPRGPGSLSPGSRPGSAPAAPTAGTEQRFLT